MASPAGQRQEQRRSLRRWTRGWAAVVASCFVVVAGALAVLVVTDTHGGALAAACTGVALVAALVALATTVARAKAGTDLDEQELTS